MGNYINNFLSDLLTNPELHAGLTNRHPILKAIKVKPLMGEAIKSPFTLSAQQNVAGTFATSKTKGERGLSGSKANDFSWIVEPGEMTDYIAISDKEKALGKTAGPQVALAAVEKAVKQGTAQFVASIAKQLVGKAGGAYGRGTYSTTGHVVTFENRSQAGRFSKGMTVEISANDGTSTGHTKVGSTGVVVSVDVANKTMVVGALGDEDTAANPGSWVNATQYYFWPEGLFQPGITTNLIFSIADLLPVASASSTLLNVDRSIDSRLSGLRLTSADVAGLSLLDAIYEISALGQSEADWEMGAERICLLNPHDFNKAARELQSQGYNLAPSGKGVYGYASLAINTVVGDINLVSEPGAERGVFRVVNLDSVAAYSANSNGEGENADWFGFVEQSGSYLVVADGFNDHVVRPVSYIAMDYGKPTDHAVGVVPSA